MKNIDLKEVDKFHLFSFILMFVGFFILLFFVDSSLIFRMEYIEKNYWFISSYELAILGWSLIVFNIGYSVSKWKGYKFKLS